MTDRDHLHRPLLAAVLWAACAAPMTADWPHLRGPASDGRAEMTGAADDAPAALDLEWRVPLGSGYSGIAVAGGRVVTMFADTDWDFVGAFDAATGAELWRHRLGDVYRGHDGSRDGPVSTPAIHDGTVFALAPHGTLHALALADGAPRWSLDLAERFAAPEPDFGFGTSPAIADGVLVVATGGTDGRAISGLDPATGEVLWSHGDGKVDYQSPVVMTLAGRRQVVAVAGQTMMGLDPATGDELWSFRFAEGDGVADAVPTPAGDDRILLLVSGDAAVFEVRESGGGLAAAEIYRSKELGNTYAPPVLHDGVLYGFRGQILTAVDAATGERLWRSRPPGGRGLILVGDRLAIYGAGGTVVLARAQREGYEELARVEAVPASGYTWPSFAGERIFVRDLEALAAVAVEPTDSPAAAQAARPAPPPAVGHLLDRFLERLAEVADKGAAVDELVAAHPEMPIVEEEWVHFLYRGEAEDLALAGTMTGGWPETMARAPGSDLFYRSVERGGVPRWEYRFLRDFTEVLTDPRNPRRAPAEWGPEVSVVTFEGWREPAFLGEPSGARGSLARVPFTSRRLEHEFELQVYLPAGYQRGDRLYPLLIVLDGGDWLEKGQLDRALDHLIGQSVEPLVAVFVPQREAWWLDAGGSGTEEYAKMLAGGLLPFLEKRYWLRHDAGSRAILGLGAYGLTGAYTVLSYPHLIGRAALVSPRLDLGYESRLFALVDQRPRPEAAFYVDWNRVDRRGDDGSVDVRRDSQRLAEALRVAGFPLRGGEVIDSYGWGGWRARADRILAALFPLR